MKLYIADLATHNDKDESNEEPTIEKGDEEEDMILNQFKNCTKPLKICNWLVAHPDILRLANQMLEMNKPLDMSNDNIDGIKLSENSSSPEISNVSINIILLSL